MSDKENEHENENEKAKEEELKNSEENIKIIQRSNNPKIRAMNERVKIQNSEIENAFAVFSKTIQTTMNEIVSSEIYQKERELKERQTSALERIAETLDKTIGKDIKPDGMTARNIDEKEIHKDSIKLDLEFKMIGLKPIDNNKFLLSQNGKKIAELSRVDIDFLYSDLSKLIAFFSKNA